MFKVINIILLYLLLLNIVACSNLSKNMTKNGKWHLTGGKYHNISWEDQLVFKRVSWFQELTLLYDFIFTENVKETKFGNWFSDFENRQIAQCSRFLLALTYSLDSRRISNKMFSAEMKKNGYEQILIPNFEENLKMHPSFNEASLGRYLILGYCSQTKQSQDPISITFSGFNTKSI